MEFQELRKCLPHLDEHLNTTQRRYHSKALTRSHLSDLTHSPACHVTHAHALSRVTWCAEKKNVGKRGETGSHGRGCDGNV
jgi:hypothetical protein